MVRFNIRKLVVLTLIVLVTLGLTVAPMLVRAQQDACFGLNASDCQLLTSSGNPPQGALSSFTMDYQLSFKGTGMAQGDSSATVHGTGPFSINGDLSDLASQAKLGTMPDMQKLMADLAKISYGNVIDVEAITKGQDQKFHVEIRLINDVLYLNAGALTQNKWQMLDLKMMAPMLAGMAGGALRPKAPGGAAGSAPNQQQMATEMANLKQIPNLIKAQRGADLTIDNQQIAVFTFQVDLPTLFNSPDFVTVVKDGQAMNPSSTTKPMTDDQIKTLASQLAKALANVQISYSRFVGVTDKLPHGGSFDLTGTVNLADFKNIKLPSSAVGGLGGAASASTGPVTLDIHLKITLSGIGQKVDVPVPAGAVPFNFGATR